MATARAIWWWWKGLGVCFVLAFATDAFPSSYHLNFQLATVVHHHSNGVRELRLGGRLCRLDVALSESDSGSSRTKADGLIIKGAEKEASRDSSGAEIPYESTIKALKAFHSMYGDLVIPRRYVVPCDDRYPKEWHGVDLASAVYNMNWWQRNVKQRPDRVSELNELGFVWARLQPEWNLVLEALITYSSIYGHIMVPTKFVVPAGDPEWPKATWGISLGKCVYRIRSRHDFLHGLNSASRRDQLDGLNFVWDVHETRFIKFYEALTHYAKLESCGMFSLGRTKALRVPATFVVPNDSRWPEKLWSFPLGEKCIAVRQKGLYVKDHPDRQKMLEELGYRWNGNADLGWLQVVHAAAIYSKLHGRVLDVPYHFVVPEPTRPSAEEWPWPDHLWGLPLGQRLKDVRTKGAYLNGEKGLARRRQLDALGFNWKPKQGRRNKSSG